MSNVSTYQLDKPKCKLESRDKEYSFIPAISIAPLQSPLLLRVELDRCIGNTHHRGRLWDNRNHWNNRQ